MFAVSRFTVNKKAQMFHSYSEIWLFAPSVLCLVLLLTRKPRCLLVTALAPQLFRDLVVRSFCVSRFTVNKKAQVVRSFCVSRFTVNKKAQMLGARQRVSESRGAPAVPHHFERVGSRRTGCSNSHRYSSPAFPRLGCSLPLCLVSLLTRKPSNAVNKKAQIWLFAPSVCLVSL